VKILSVLILNSVLKISGPAWPRDNYGYIAMSAPTSGYQGRSQPYEEANGGYAGWEQTRQWAPSCYNNPGGNSPGPTRHPPCQGTVDVNPVRKSWELACLSECVVHQVKICSIEFGHYSLVFVCKGFELKSLMGASHSFWK
jgi:hypothetical protein